ncbi:RagB/SusD family nutrient uptake outer membrane protein [Elizabethkingia ursingii]|uniref:RagB/SusD family nutrient uptake outer membrane protein n=1 Tax=Elizabethkingia ursingii TaxID=1756150 RepID=UPI0020130A71|nr:RagB/SusD family nutrient uptake outer membrane protein [Elizabethkingia ursingii]MCL1663594.1 RagB/SusD family nutrient uptake outer membrane protein [Elizabethkingia ursingii]
MKKIKFNIKTFILTVGISAGLASCNSDYLETSPTDNVNQDMALSTADNLKALVNGMHRNMYYRQNSSQGQSGQAGVMIMTEAASDDVIWASTGNNWYISSVRWLDQGNENSSNTYYPYQFYYSMIRNANLVINNAAKVTGDQQIIDTAVGEALTYRAFSYFNLVQFYGKRYVAGANNNQEGVPLRLEANEKPLARASVEDVYAQVNKDLQLALTKLSGVGRYSKSHFDSNIVKGLLARVALTQGNYKAAANYAKEARAGYPLMDNAAYKAGFNSAANIEWMWATIMVPDQSDGFGNFSAYMSRNYNSTQIRQAPKLMNSTLVQLFPATDVRTQVVDPSGNHIPWLSTKNAQGKIVRTSAYSNYSVFPYSSQKFMVKDQGEATADVPYMRAAEMYLIEAEALARLGDEAGSKAVFNELQKNRNTAYAGASTSGAAYITEILNTRRLELWGEGFRWFDLKRLGQDLDRTGTNQSDVVMNGLVKVPSTDFRWQWQIPRAEINASQGVVTQNPLQ